MINITPKTIFQAFFVSSSSLIGCTIKIIPAINKVIKANMNTVYVIILGSIMKTARYIIPTPKAITNVNKIVEYPPTKLNLLLNDVF